MGSLMRWRSTTAKVVSVAAAMAIGGGQLGGAVVATTPPSVPVDTRNPDPDATLRHLTAVAQAISFSPFEPNNRVIDSQWQGLVYDRLLRLRSDLSGVDPWLAQDWEFSEDGSALTLTIQDGVKFHDGTDLTAEVVAENLLLQREHGGADALANVAAVTAADATTVVITFSRPDPAILFAFTALPGMIVSDAGLADLEALKTEPQGSGPYELVSSDAALNYRLERWGDHWNEEYLATAPAVITTASTPDSTTRFNAIRAGEADYGYADSGMLEQVQNDPNVQYAVYDSITPWVVFVNNSTAPFDNPAALDAINLGIDREAFNAVSNESCPPLYQPFPEGLDGYIDGYVQERNLDEARRILEDAGLMGATVSVLDFGGSGGQTQFPTLFFTQLEEIGFNVEVGEQVDRNTARQVWAEGNYSTMLNQLTSGGIPTSASYLDVAAFGREKVGNADEELQAMHEAAEVLPLFSEERDAAYQDIAQYMLDSPQWISVCASLYVQIATPGVIGLDTMPTGRLSQAADFSLLTMAE